VQIGIGGWPNVAQHKLVEWANLVTTKRLLTGALD